MYSACSFCLFENRSTTASCFQYECDCLPVEYELLFVLVQMDSLTTLLYLLNGLCNHSLQWFTYF